MTFRITLFLTAFNEISFSEPISEDVVIYIYKMSVLGTGLSWDYGTVLEQDFPGIM
jgi:hypothetical protein